MKRVSISIVLAVIASLLSFIATQAFKRVVLNESGIDFYSAAYASVVYFVVYALIPGIVLLVLAIRSKNRVRFSVSVAVPLVWGLLFLLFFLYHRDFMRYGIDVSLYANRMGYFSFDRSLPIFLPSLILGSVFWWVVREISEE